MFQNHSSPEQHCCYKIKPWSNQNGTCNWPVATIFLHRLRCLELKFVMMYTASSCNCYINLSDLPSSSSRPDKVECLSCNGWSIVGPGRSIENIALSYNRKKNSNLIEKRCSIGWIKWKKKMDVIIFRRNDLGGWLIRKIVHQNVSIPLWFSVPPDSHSDSAR